MLLGKVFGAKITATLKSIVKQFVLTNGIIGHTIIGSKYLDSFLTLRGSRSWTVDLTLVTRQVVISLTPGFGVVLD